MKFYDLVVKRLKISGLINSIFELKNNENKAGVEFSVNETSNPFIGFDKTNKELVASNDGINFFPLYNGDSKPLVVEKYAVDEYIYLPLEDGFPVGIGAPNDKIIPTQKETVVVENNNYVIDLSAYMSYAGLDSDEGVWKVYVAAGSRGSKGDPGESLKLEVGTVVSGASPSVEIVGDSPNQTINFVLPAFGNSFEIVKTSVNNEIYVSAKGIPVMLKTNTGKFYNIRGKEISLNETKNQFVINISNALAVNNASSFSGEWVVYYAGSMSLSDKVTYHKLLSNDEISQIPVAEGEIVSFYNSQGVLCTKKSNGIIEAVENLVTLGQIDSNGNFQPLSIDGTTASANGGSETINS